MLTLEHISKTFGRRAALRDVSLDVRPGELVGYVGGNGAGKTTSMRIMLGVTEPTDGRVLMDGRPVDAAVRARMGYMPEERGLYPSMTIRSQLEFFARLHGTDRRSAATAAGYWLDRLGLQERHGSNLEDLSLGNQQRVQLAAALVHEPAVLVLDEPFSGLDPIAVDLMAEVLREEADRGVPVIFSSHQLDLVERLCDRVAILRDGQIVADGTVTELARNVGTQLLVRSTAEPSRWLAELPSGDNGYERLTDREGAVRLRLHGTASTRALVDAVQRHGDLLEVRPWQPSLTETYRAVIETQDDSAGSDDHDDIQKKGAAA